MPLAPYIVPAIIAAAVLFFIFLVSYKKAKPDEALIVSGAFRREPKVLIGKSGFSIPFLQRTDRIDLGLIQIDVRAAKIPTREYININVDAVANVQIPKSNEFIQVAAQNFLNKKQDYIRTTIQQVLEGNMREIIGQIELTKLINSRDEFAQKVQINVTEDMKRVGMVIVNFVVQNLTDDTNAINDLGIDNLVRIQKEAKIARANAEADVAIKQSEAAKMANDARVNSEREIAERNKELSIAKSQAQAEADTELAKAEAAKEIQKQIQQKTVNENEVNAETAKAEKMLELKEREIALKEKELEAAVKKQADADRYAIEQKAQAEKAKRIADAEASNKEEILEAEANKQKKILNAEGIKAEGLAEAEAIRAKALAEAEGIEKKAEAQAKMAQASIIEMVVNKLPEIAKEISAPLNNIDSITMYDPNGTTKLVENGTRMMEQVFKVADSSGIKLDKLINNFIGGDVAEPIKE